MSKKKKVKYYAIKEGIGVKDRIVTSWEECSKLVLGYNSVYKSFRTEEEAKEYLGKVDVNKVKEQTKIGIEVSKKKRATTKAINLRVSNELYKDFEDKCNNMNIDKDKAIIMLIEEWVLE